MCTVLLSNFSWIWAAAAPLDRVCAYWFTPVPTTPHSRAYLASTIYVTSPSLGRYWYLSLWSPACLLHACVLSCFSHVQFCETLWTAAHQAPCPWDSPGKNTGVGCHVFHQGIFPTQGSNILSYVSCVSCIGRQVLYQQHHLGSPWSPEVLIYTIWTVVGSESGRGCGNPLRYSCLENPHGQGNLAG